jgi:hypothetical protein
MEVGEGGRTEQRFCFGEEEGTGRLGGGLDTAANSVGGGAAKNSKAEALVPVWL